VLDSSVVTEMAETKISGSDLDASLEGKPRILIVDDDQDYIGMLKLILRQADFDVSGAIDHQSAVEKCEEIKPDVILLDLMMPGMDGYGIFELLRKVTIAPIIFISAAPRTDNVVRGLELGAEDFISKPFHNAELVARIRKALRQVESSRDIQARYFPDIDLRVDFDAHEVALRGHVVRLLQREYALLKILVEQAPRNIPYEQITTQIWGEDNAKTRAHLKTIVFALRRKLEKDPNKPHLIVNNRGLGYQLETRPTEG
jgi:DNA-binding response OmpR family regulator